jgi:predicted lactoylglutathione lyase
MSTPVLVSLPISDRRISHTFYRHVLGIEALGEPADDGVPEPLQFELNSGIRVMLVPTGGFDWLLGVRELAAPTHVGCVLGLDGGTPGGVDAVLSRASAAGADILLEPEQLPWGMYVGGFADPDGNVWMATAPARDR